MKNLLIVLSGISVTLGIILGVCSGFGAFAWGIYTFILLCKGTVATTFLNVLMTTVCTFGCYLIGIVVAGLFALLGTFLLFLSDSFKN